MGTHDNDAVHMRRTRESDLDFVLQLEGDPENSPYVGSWSREQHRAVLSAPGREHWIIETGPERSPAGYLIVYDFRTAGRGVHLKRIVVGAKGRGIGRRAVSWFADRALTELGAPFAWLDVLADNLRAQGAYRAAGFEVVWLDQAELREWGAAVDGFEEKSLVMRKG